MIQTAGTHKDAGAFETRAFHVLPRLVALSLAVTLTAGCPARTAINTAGKLTGTAVKTTGKVVVGTARAVTFSDTGAR